MLLALGLAVSSCGGNTDHTAGPTSAITSSTSEAPSSEPPLVEGLSFVEVGPLPSGFRPQAASPGYVIGITAGNKSVEVRDGAGTTVLHTYNPPPSYSVRQVFLDEPRLVVVTKKQDDSDRDQLVVLDLESFAERRLDETAPPTAQGSWAVGAGRVAYGSNRGDDYCLALVDLDTLQGGLRECVPPRHGIFQVGISPYGVGYTTFDDRRPSSCGTARVQVDGAAPETVQPEEECAPWEASLVTGEAVIWSEVHDKQAVEEAIFYARVGDGEVQVLGGGTTGSLVWCGESAWYVDQGPSQLFRWTPDDGLQLAYQIPDKAGLIGAPVCTNGSISFPAYLDDDPDSTEYIVRATLT